MRRVGPVRAHARGDGARTLDGVWLVSSGIGAGRVAPARAARWIDPTQDDRGAAANRLVPRVIAILGSLAEQVRDRIGIVGDPGGNIAIEPGLNGRMRHGVTPSHP